MRLYKFIRPRYVDLELGIVAPTCLYQVGGLDKQSGRGFLFDKVILSSGFVGSLRMGQVSCHF